MDQDPREIAHDLIEWMMEPQNFLVVEFCAQQGLSRHKFELMAKDSPELDEALKLAFTIQEAKVAKGALGGFLKEKVALKLLETFHEWKGENRTVNTSEFKIYADTAEKRAIEIMRRETHAIDDDEDDDEDEA